MENISQHREREQFSERELVILRLMSDGLSNQEIADRLFLALTTVKWYIRQINDKLDTHTRTQTVARARQLRLIEDGDGALRVLTDDHEPPENPYKGLHAFQETDAADFFGREALIERLLARLTDTGAMSRFLAVVGPSGSGKSSLVNAGLIPALRRGALPGSQKWLIAEILPGTHPLEELEIALHRLTSNPLPSLLPQLQEDERGLLRAVRRVLPDDHSELLLVIDQFEEVFTLVESPAERQHFLNSIYAAATDARGPLRVVVTLRADFYDRPLLDVTFGELIYQRTEVVLPLTVEELERVITRPAARVGVRLDAGLVAVMAAEANQQPGGLPLLQYALTELFDGSQSNALTLKDYRAVGGVLGALGWRADVLYEGLDGRGQETARQMWLRLVTLGEGVEDTRRRALMAELLSVGADPNRMDEIIQTFAAYRFLTLDRDPRTGQATVEVAHEALIREWRLLRGWLDESRADVRLQRLLAGAAGEWVSGGRDPGFLLGGSRLAQFEEWAGKTTLALTGEERAFLAASLAERERLAALESERQAREKRLERRSRTILRALVVVLLLAALGGFSLAGVAVNQSQIAQRNEAEARSLALASSAQLQLNQGNVDQAVALAQSALQIGDNELAQRVLDLAAFAPRAARIFQESTGFVPAALNLQPHKLSFVMIAPFGADFGPFAQVMIQGMEDACALLNASCQWLSDGPDPALIVPQWDKALALNPDGIGTTLHGADLIRGHIERAIEQGIPVIVFNIARGQGDDRSLPVSLYIGSDEYIGGQTNARRVFAEALADGVTIHRGVCTNQGPEYSLMIVRCAGVESIFDEEGVPLDQIPISDSPGLEAANQIADYFAKNPDTNAIFVLRPNSASALNLYFKQAGLQSRQLYATTHDTSPEIFQMIRDGYLLQTIDQQPYMQGFQTIISLYLYRQYGLRPSGFINTASVVDRNNVDSVIQLGDAGYR